MHRGGAVSGACALVLAVGASPAFGHSDRTTYYPNWNTQTPKFDPPPEVGPPGSVPKYRNRGTALIVCKADSRRRILALPRKTKRDRAVRRRNLGLVRHCRFRHLQAAVNAAVNITRILILPGVYREEPTRAVPDDEPKCNDMTQPTSDGHHVPTYEYQFNCPNAQNLVGILGDGPDADRK